jgi:L-ascorbate metabolism protein UlaG (beta-lactamase superfamily)
MKNSIITRFNSLRLKHGEFAVCHLGQHSFILKLGEAVIYIDPYLTSERARLIAPLLTPEEITNAAIVAGSHDHGDHIDRPSWPGIAAASPDACFIVPEAVRKTVVRDTGIAGKRVFGLNDGGSIEIKGVKISAVAAAHEFLDYDPKTGLYPYLGLIFEGSGVTVYHAGDCCIYEGLQTRLQKWSFDLAMLPINGRDAKRLKNNCIGNMTYQEAADLAGALKPGLTIPAHYDMFAMNSINPKLFLDYMKVKYPHLKCAMPRRGTLFHRHKTN